MGAVSSLGKYKVVVTADYKQLKEQFKAMTEFVAKSTKDMTDNLNKTMGGVNAAMLSQMKTTIEELKKSFDGLEKAPAKAGDGFKSIAKQVREAKAEMEKAYQEVDKLRQAYNMISVDGYHGKKDLVSVKENALADVAAKLKEAEARAEVLRSKYDDVAAAQKRFKDFANQTNSTLKEQERIAIAGTNAHIKALERNEKITSNTIQARMKGNQQLDAQGNVLTSNQIRRIEHLKTQYRVAYEEINKYLQSHAKMSEAVFIRLQGKITALGSELQKLGATPPMPNPLANLDYEKYINGFSKLGDVIDSVKHHLMWMASAAVIGAGFGIPMGVSKAIESFDALQTKIMQNMELANQYEGNNQKLHSDISKMGEAAKTFAQGFGVSLNEVQEGMQIITRRFKDADTAIYLTSVALQMAKLDMVDVKQSAKDLEAVMLQFNMGAKDANKFLNDFSVICHVARISGTDMLMALERSGSAFKAMNMDARAAMAAIAAVSTVTGKSGATIGDSWKSILANMDFKKATQALEAYNIKLYEVGQNGTKTMRNGTAVLADILRQFKELDDEGRRKLATAIAGGKYQVNNMMAFLADASGSFNTFLDAMNQKSSDAMTAQLLAASMDTYETRLNQAKAAFENLGVTIGEIVLPHLKNFALLMTGLGLYLQQHAGTIVGIAGACAKLAMGFIAVALAMGTWNVFTGIAAGVRAAMTGVALAQGASAIATMAYNLAVGIQNGLMVLATPLTMAWAYATSASGVASFVASGFVGLLIGSIVTLETVLAPVGLALLGVIAVIGVLGTIAYEVYENWETVSNDLTYIWNTLVDVISAVIEAIILALAPLFVTIYLLGQIIGFVIKSVIAPIFKFLGELVQSVITAINGWLKEHGITTQNIANHIRYIWNNFIQWLASSISPAFAQWLSDMVEKLVAFAKKVWEIASSVKNAIRSMFGMAQSAGENGGGFIDSIASSIKSKLSFDLLNTIADSKAEMAKAPYATAPEIPTGSIPNAIPSGGSGSKGKSGKGKTGKGAKEADNSIEAILYRFLTKEKKESHNRAVGELAAIQSMSGFNYKAGEGTDRRGLYGWDKEQWAKYEKWLKGTGYKDSAVSQINYQHAYAQVRDNEEKSKYQDYLKSNSITAYDFAQAFSQYITKGGTIDSGIINSFDKRFAKKKGEENYDDPMKAVAERYDLLKKEYDRELDFLKTKRAKSGQRVTAEEELKLYEKIMGIGNGKNPFAYHEAAIKDYEKKLLEMAKYEIQRTEAIKKATETQVSAIEKMADAEIAFSEKIGLLTKKDVRQYQWNKNERDYASKRPMMDAMLGGTVDMSKGTADDMLAALQGLLYAQNEAEAKIYADRIMWLSRDVQATEKALNERLKLEEKYQQERYRLEQETFMYKNRFLYGFVDGFVDAWSDGLESILNRTKTFAEALQDMFKKLVNSIIHMFVEDWAGRLKNILMKSIHQVVETGYGQGTHHDRGQQIGQFTGAALGDWAGSSLSSLKLGKGKDGKNSKGVIANALVSPTDINYVKTNVNKMANVATQGANVVANATKNASQQALTTTTTNAVAEQSVHAQKENAETQMTITGAQAREQATNQAHISVMKNIGMMITQMLAAMAIMAVFSALFGGGRGNKTSTSTSSENLGRAPETYYMTPTPVLQSTTYQIPSFDIGGNIEKDMFAMVHKNEMVLTPDQADVIRNTARNSGSIGGGANANVKSNISVSTVDSKGFDRVLQNYSRDLSKQVGKGIRNGYLTAKGLI